MAESSAAILIFLTMRNSLLVLLAVLALSSCKKNPTDPGEEPDPVDSTVHWTMPTAGSQFVMAIETTDSSAERNYTYQETDVFRIIEANVPWMGRDSTFRYGWSASSATYHVTFEPNGNTGYEANGGIEIYPTGTKVRQGEPTTNTDFGDFIVSDSNYKDNHGAVKIALAGVTYDAIKIFGKTATVSIDKTSGQVLSHLTTQQTWWFVPSLGFCAKTVREIISENGGLRTINRRSQTLSQIIR
jgi:hypothetical protein